MPRAVQDAKLESRAARARLKARGKPYYRHLEPGLHLGYRKARSGPGSWVVRVGTNGSDYNLDTFGAADDIAAADGQTILDYKQALAKARTLALRPDTGPASFTVSDALELYTQHLVNAGRTEAAVRDAGWRVKGLIAPSLGTIEVQALTAERVRRWLHGLVRAAPRLRTRSGEKQKHQHGERDADGMRGRRASANRNLAVLKAGLNHAFREGRTTNIDWRRVQTFRGVDSARVRYLTVADAQRLINACEPEFRPLVEAALQTGARHGQLAALRVDDFNPDSGTVRLRSRKGDGTEKTYHATLTDEGVSFFRRQCAGRARDALMFVKSAGEPWDKSHQARPMQAACERARIAPIGFHGLRHTWASLATMNGTPLLVVAKNLGHSDTRMVEKHYGHLAPSFISAAIHAGAPRFGSAKQSNVAPLDDRR